MGRSQVERNRIKGRPGRGGGGRGRGGGRCDYGGRTTNSKRSGPDPRTLGDNAFRFESHRQKDNAGAVVDDEGMLLLDDFSTGLLLGSDYYGASHYDLQEGDYEGEDTATSLLYQQTTSSSSRFENSSNDWMSIDIQALSNCLKLLPIHERLDVPYHVGKHIESRYGIDNNNATEGKKTKKTLAELREESKCIVNNSDCNFGVATMKSTSSDCDVQMVEEVDANKNSLETNEPVVDKCRTNDGDDDDDEDLDAWLDDMIS
jgi:hypothetical protein